MGTDSTSVPIQSSSPSSSPICRFAFRAGFKRLRSRRRC